MKKQILLPVLTDVQFWIPVAILILGTALLVVVR